MKSRLFLLFLLGHSCLGGAVTGANLRLQDDLVGPIRSRPSVPQKLDVISTRALLKRQTVRKQVRTNSNLLQLKRAAAARSNQSAVQKLIAGNKQVANKPQQRKLEDSKAAATKAKQAAATKAKQAAATKANQTVRKQVKTNSNLLQLKRAAAARSNQSAVQKLIAGNKPTANKLQQRKLEDSKAAATKAKQVAPVKAKQVAPVKAQQVAPVKAQQVAPVKAQQVAPVKAQQVAPVKAQQVAPVKAQQVALVKAQQVAPVKAKQVHQQAVRVQQVEQARPQEQSRIEAQQIQARQKVRLQAQARLQEQLRLETQQAQARQQQVAAQARLQEQLRLETQQAQARQQQVAEQARLQEQLRLETQQAQARQQQVAAQARLQEQLRLETQQAQVRQQQVAEQARLQEQLRLETQRAQARQRQIEEQAHLQKQTRLKAEQEQVRQWLIEETAQIAKILNPNAGKKVQMLAYDIKALNPQMEDFIVSAWANSKAPDLEAAMGGNLDDAQLTYTFQRPGLGQPIETVYRHIMPGYRLSCGYYSLGIRPEEAKEQLLASLKPGNPNAQRYKSMISNEILEATRGQNGLPQGLKDNQEILRLKRNMDETQLEIDEYVRSLNTLLENEGKPRVPVDQLNRALFRHLFAELGGINASEFFELLDQAKETLQKTTINIEEWCKRDNIIQAYIDAEIKPGVELTFLKNAPGEQKVGIIDVLADIKGLDLNIYEPDVNAPQQLKLTHSYMKPGAVRGCIKLIYTPGHFDRLERIFHRHQIPVVEFQDPFVNYQKEEILDADFLLFSKSMKDVHAELHLKEKQLEEKLFNLVGYNDEKRDAFIENYMRLELTEGRYLTPRSQAEQAYNTAKTDVECQIEEGRKARTSVFVKRGLDTLDAKKKNLAVLGNALEMVGLDILPTIKYPEGFKSYGQGKVNDMILKKWADGYNFFQIKADGLYGGKKQNDEDVDLDDAALEKLLKFEGKKVIEIKKENPQDNPGVQLFYTRNPEPKEVNIYDDMEKDARKFLLNGIPQHVNLIQAGKSFFQQRQEILDKAARGNYLDVFTAHHMIHVYYSDPKGLCYDKVAIDQRLNNIHNAMTRTYLTAKERGEAALRDYFTRAVPQIIYCMDGNSGSYQDYALAQEKGLDTNLKEALKKERKRKLLDRLNDQGKDGSEGDIRAGLQDYVGLETSEGIFQKQDIEELIRYARVDLMIID